MASYLDEFLNKPRNPQASGDIFSGLYNPQQIADLESQYTNQYGIQNTRGGIASDARHMAAMNNLSNSLSPMNNGIGNFIGDTGAFLAGGLNEIGALGRGFNKENFREIGEDIAANFKGSFGTPNSTTAEDIYSQVFSGAVPQRVASGTPTGYGAAQASELTDLERDFPGMSTGDIIDSMNNRAFIGRQISPMAKPQIASPRTVIDPNRIPGRIQESVEPLTRFRDASSMAEYLQGNPQIMDNIQNTIGSGIDKFKSGLGSLKDFFGSGINNAKEGIMGSSAMDFLRGLPTPGNLLMNMAATRNPLNPRASNYNPTLQGQIDFMQDQGMYGKNPNTGLGQITGGRLAGKNLVSGFGTNDLGGMYSNDLSKLEGYLETMPQRFSRLMKNNPTSYQNKINNLNAKIAQNKREAEQAQAAREASTAARAMAKNPEVYSNAGISSGGFASQNTGTNSSFSNRTGRGRTGYQEGGLASMFTRRR